MNNCFTRYILLILAFLPFIWIISCSGRSGVTKENSRKNISTAVISPSERFIRMSMPAENEEYRLKDQIKIS
jgi:hypothetical protein